MCCMSWHCAHGCAGGGGGGYTDLWNPVTVIALVYYTGGLIIFEINILVQKMD